MTDLKDDDDELGLNSASSITFRRSSSDESEESEGKYEATIVEKTKTIKELRAEIAKLREKHCQLLIELVEKDRLGYQVSRRACQLV